MKKILLSVLVAVSSHPLFAGGSMTGGTPPAKSRTELLEQLMAKAPGNGGIFDSEPGNIGLGVNTQLAPELLVSKSSTSADVIISEEDFIRLSSTLKTVDAIDISGASRSYSIQDGNTIDSLLLKDRREAIRAGGTGGGSTPPLDLMDIPR